MLQFFCSVFRPYNLSEEQVRQFADTCAGMMLITLVGVSQDVLDPEARRTLQNAWEEKRWDIVWRILEEKNGSVQWKELLKKHARPVFIDYVEKVTGKPYVPSCDLRKSH